MLLYGGEKCRITEINKRKLEATCEYKGNETCTERQDGMGIKGTLINYIDQMQLILV